MNEVKNSMKGISRNDSPVYREPQLVECGVRHISNIIPEKGS